ncbi:hypothetical protein PSNVIR_03640 [Pseudomonas sp. Nvir]|nr:hypothetical protein PSNVIR_03640 [Pseudomonas sp. Nvir]
MVPGKGSRCIFSAYEIERRPRGAIASCARSNRRCHTLWQTPVSPKAIPVGAWLASDGPQSGADFCQFCSATLALPWRVSISPIKRLASAG